MRFSPKAGSFKLTLGERGEMAAWGYLLENGYKILEKNYRCKIGEIDVIARKGKRLVFIEVKTRISERYGPPEESVHRMKQKKIAQTAQWYRKEKGLMESPVSVEVIAIDWREGGEPVIRLIADAFSMEHLQADY